MKPKEEKSKWIFQKQSFPDSTLLNIGIGALSGICEVSFIGQPCWTLKTILQSGSKISFNPRILYTGLSANIASMGPGTAVQMGAYKFIEQKYSANRSLNPFESSFFAFTAGALSAGITSPTELVMTIQGQKKMGLLEATSFVYQNKGFAGFTKGLFGQSMRDGIYCAAVLSFVPQMKKAIKPIISHENANTLTAGLLSGLIATLLSQPSDVIKTKQQTGLSKTGFFRTGVNIYRNKGMPGFYEGVTFRGTRVCLGVLLIAHVKDYLDNLLKVPQDLGAVSKSCC